MVPIKQNALQFVNFHGFSSSAQLDLLSCIITQITVYAFFRIIANPLHVDCCSHVNLPCAFICVGCSNYNVLLRMNNSGYLILVYRGVPLLSLFYMDHFPDLDLVAVTLAGRHK